MKKHDVVSLIWGDLEANWHHGRWPWATILTIGHKDCVHLLLLGHIFRKKKRPFWGILTDQGQLPSAFPSLPVNILTKLHWCYRSAPGNMSISFRATFTNRYYDCRHSGGIVDSKNCIVKFTNPTHPKSWRFKLLKPSFTSTNVIIAVILVGLSISELLLEAEIEIGSVWGRGGPKLKISPSLGIKAATWVVETLIRIN